LNEGRKLENMRQ